MFKYRNSFYFLICAILLYPIFLSGDENRTLKMPSYWIEDTVLYLANQLKVNLIYTNTDGQRSKVFSQLISSPEEIIKKFQEENKDVISIHYDSANRTIICSDIRTNSILENILKSNIALDKNKEPFILFGKKRIKIEILGDSLKESRVSIANSFVSEYGKVFLPDLKVMDFILKAFEIHNNSVCMIDIPIPYSDKEDLAKKRHLDELKQRIEAIESGAIAVEKGELEILKEVFQMMQLPDTQRYNSFRILFTDERYGVKNSNATWITPTYEQIAEYLKLTSKGKIMKAKEAFHGNIDFFFYQYLTFDAINLMRVLFEHNIFDEGRSLPSMLSGPFVVYEIPDILMKLGNYEALEYLITNLNKVKDKNRLKTMVRNLATADKNQLDKKSQDIVMSFAKELKIEEIYADTSKWVGDDLPDDYDRWQNFKVSDTEIAFERDKTIANIKYHLRFLKYKEPIKIGGIPLKKMEEADYSTPEKAYFSVCSERTYEWSKYSVYEAENYTEHDFNIFNCWKPWHSGFNPFFEILYKVEIDKIGKKQVEAPDLFLIVNLISHGNIVANIPMKFTDNRWKFYRSTPLHLDVLSDYIREEIAKNERIAKSDKH